MICDNCGNSNYKITGVPSCCLPHCSKPQLQKAKRFAELFWIPMLDDRARTELEETEFQMLRAELNLR